MKCAKAKGIGRLACLRVPVSIRVILMTDTSADLELRKITNHLLKISSECDIHEMEREAGKHYREFNKSFPDKSIYFNRRLLDVKRLMFIEKMSSKELYELYRDYQKHGFDSLYHKLSSLFFIHKYISDLDLKIEIENVIVDLIRDHEGDAAIHSELSWMPDLVQKALGARKSD